MSDHPQSLSPMPTPPTAIPGPPPSSPAPSLPVAGAEQQAPLTGLQTRETLEQREKDKAAQKRQEALNRQQSASSSRRSSSLPPQPRRAAPSQDTAAAASPAPSVPPIPCTNQLGIAAPTMGNPAVQAMIMQLFNQSKLPGQKFHMLVLPEDDWPRMRTFETIEELIAEIKEYLGTATHIFPFVGQPMGITAGPNHHLRTPYGMLPLFDIPTENDAVEVPYGWVGPSLERADAPTLQDEEIIEAAADDAGEEQAQCTSLLPPAVPPLDETPVFGVVE